MLALLVASTYAGDILDIIEDCGKTLKKILNKSLYNILNGSQRYTKNILPLLQKEKKTFLNLVNPKKMIDFYYWQLCYD